MKTLTKKEFIKQAKIMRHEMFLWPIWKQAVLGSKNASYASKNQNTKNIKGKK